MAGLLDFLNTPDGQGLLSAAFGGLAGARTGQPINSIGRAGLAGLSGYTGAQDREQQNATDAMRNKYMQSQIDDNVSKNAQMVQALAATQKRENYFMGDGTGGQAAQSPNALPPSAFTPSLGGMGPVAPMSERPAPQAQAGGKFDEWSRQYGIPVDALKADFMTNGGKGISDMLMKRGAPDMQVANGYAYDKNKQGAGYLPSLSTSQDGKTSMVQIGPDGQPVISAPQGALNTYNAYQGAQANFKPIKVFNPETQREEYTNEGAVVGGQGQALPNTATTPGSFRQANPNANLMVARPGESDQSQIYAGALATAKQQLAAARTPEDANRARSDIAGIQGEMNKAGIRSPAPQSGNFAAGPSANEAAIADANRTRMVDTAKADVGRDTASQTKVRNAGETISSVDRAISLLGKNPTSSGVGSMADSGAAFFGKTLPGADVAAQLDVVSADIVKNVPRFEGPQSDKDVEQYKSAAGRVADRTLPVSQRLAAAQEVKLLQSRAVGAGTSSAASGAKPAPGKVLDTLPTANGGNKGQRIRDTTTGKILVSNGLQWKAE